LVVFHAAEVPPLVSVRVGEFQDVVVNERIDVSNFAGFATSRRAR
jgi:hypothetical protein